MEPINLNDLSVTITADDTAFIVDLDKRCFAETYMDTKPYRWPNPEDNDRLWGYIQGPANVRIPTPDSGKHELELLIGGRLFVHEHDFPDPNAKTETYPEPENPITEEPISEEVSNEPASVTIPLVELEELHKYFETAEHTIALMIAKYGSVNCE